MKQYLIIAIFLAVSVSSLELLQNQLKVSQADGKVKVDFYFQSLCPYCQQYIVGTLKTAAATKDFWKICELNFYPYGNARRTQDGSGWAFTCQHGVRECQGNLIETCAIRKYEFYQYALPFIICLQGNSADWISQGMTCAGRYNMDWNAINKCATTSEGNQFQYEMALLTEKLNPPHSYVPWFVINDEHSSSAQNAIRTDMVKYVCSIYKGPEKIAACN